MGMQEGVKQMLLAMEPLTSIHSLNLGGNRIKVCALIDVQESCVTIVCSKAAWNMLLSPCSHTLQPVMCTSATGCCAKTLSAAGQCL